MRVLQREKSELERTCREMKEQLQNARRSIVSYLHECHGCGMWYHASFAILHVNLALCFYVLDPRIHIHFYLCICGFQVNKE